MKTILDTVDFYKWFVDDFIYRDGEVLINLSEGASSEKEETLHITEGASISGAHKIIYKENGIKLTVHFEDVIFFQAYDELRHKDDLTEEREEGLLASFTKSSLLEYIQQHTLIPIFEPNSYTHYSLITGEFWFHVVSRTPPKIIEHKHA